MIKLKALFVLAVALVSVSALASGPSVYEMGSKASAQAGAFVARAEDATVVYYNPAGLAFLESSELDFNMTYLNVDGKYSSPTMGSHKDNAKNFFIPSAFFATKFNDRVSFGFAVLPHYNLSTDWSDNFPGRFVSRHAKLVTYTYRPAITFKLNDHNALSIGLDYHDSLLNLTRCVDTTIFSTDAGNGFVNPYNIIYSEGSIDTHLRDQALGWNIAYMGKWDPWSFGITYQSKASFNYDGHTSFETSPLIGAHKYAFAGTRTRAELDAVPATAMIGIAYNGKPLKVEFDVDWTQWSQWDSTWARFQDHTSSTIRVPVPGVGLIPVAVPVVEDEMLYFDWGNTMTYRLGFAYEISPKVELRWGVLYDEAPVPNKTMSPVLPDQDRWSLQFGTGYKGEKLGIDWYIMYLQSKEGDITSNNIYRYNDNGLYSYPMTPDGSYKFKTWLAGIQVNYKF